MHRFLCSRFALCFNPGMVLRTTQGFINPEIGLSNPRAVF